MNSSLLFKALSSRTWLFLSIVSKKLLRNKDCQRILKELPFFAKAEVYRANEAVNLTEPRGGQFPRCWWDQERQSAGPERRHKDVFLGL